MKIILPGLLLFIFGFIPSDKCEAQQWPATDAATEASGRLDAISLGLVSSIHNQAGLADVKNMSFALNAESRFSGLGLNNVSFIGVLPSKSGVFGIDIQQFGYNLYTESKLGLAYSRYLARTLSMGIQLNYLRRAITEYGVHSDFSAEAGLLFHPSKDWMAGIHLYNISFSKNPLSGETYPVRFSAGIRYASSSSLNLLAGLEKEVSMPASFRTGVEYHVTEKISLRTGLISAPFEWSFGLGYAVGQWQIDAASSYHQWLGISPMLTLSYVRNK